MSSTSITASPSTTALRTLPAIAWMVLIYLLSDQPRLPHVPTLSIQAASILGHLGAYFALAILLWWALGALDLSPRHRFLLTLSGAVLYGVGDEWHQSFVPGRQPDILDVATDAIGALAGLVTIGRLARSRRFGHLIPR